MHLARSLSLLLRQAGKAVAFAVGGRAVASWLMILLPEGQERPSKPASQPACHPASFPCQARAGALSDHPLEEG